MPRDNTYDLKKYYNNILKKNPLIFGHQFIVELQGKDLPSYLAKGHEQTECFTYYVQSSSIPEEKIKEATVNFLSQDFIVPNQVFYDGTWDVKVLIEQNLTQYRALYAWQNEFASLHLSGGGKKIIPNVIAKVSLLDASLQNKIHTFILEGVFPTKIPDLQMQYENAANILDFQCTFNYQYMYYEDDTDPLQAKSVQ